MPAEMKVVFLADKAIAGISEKVAKPLVTIVVSEYANEVKRLMRDSPATGRWYKSKRTKKTMHRASAPGEPPAPDTGDLWRSIRWLVRKSSLGWVGEVGSTKKYAKYLEFGAARGDVMRARDMRGRFTKAFGMRWMLFPRPAWGPGLQTIRARMPEFLARARRIGGRRKRG